MNQKLLEKRYFQNSETSWDEVVNRVVRHAIPDSDSRSEGLKELVSSTRFLPSRMTYMGTEYPMSSSCFVFPMEDDLPSIMQSLSNACQVQKYGGGCIGGESIIITSEGPLPIKEFVKNADSKNKVLSYNPVTKETDFETVSNWHTTETLGKDVYEISFKGHNETIFSKIRASAWHPFFVFNGKAVVEVRADELKEGMVIIGSTAVAHEPNEFAWLLGYSIGDAAIGLNASGTPRVRILDENKEAIERAAIILDGNCRQSTSKQYISDVYIVEKAGGVPRKIYNMFDFAPHSHTKYIPKDVWCKDVDYRFSVLVGYLDADGHYNKEKSRLDCFTVSEQLADDLMVLAGSLGITSYKKLIPSSRSNERDGWRVIFSCTKQILEKICTFSSKYKTLYKNHGRGKTPLDSRYIDALNNRGYKINSFTALTRFEIGGTEVSLRQLLATGNTTKHNACAIFTELGDELMAQAIHSSQTVESVVCTNEDETLYDLTVPNTQTYIASQPEVGSYVVVHNTGYNFSKLRPQGQIINTSGGEASGPVSFMGLFHRAMEVVNRAGKKHAAQMGILNVNHPDIHTFLKCKDIEGSNWTFNISVGITDDFMNAVENNDNWDLIYKDKVFETVNAKDLWNEICKRAWNNGEPGVIFLDTINRNNKFPFYVDTTNPCGEQCLPTLREVDGKIVPSGSSCNLGSIDVSKFVVNGQIQYDELAEATRLAVYFLDKSLDNGKWPVDDVTKSNLLYRNVGLGVMGWADTLIKCGVAYASDEGVEYANNVMKFINDTASDESTKLGGGVRRNITVTSIAPTGSISMLAQCSSGIEPIFGVVETKSTYVGTYIHVNALFEAFAKERGFWSEELMEEIKTSGTVQGNESVPEDVQLLFMTANEISLEWHLRHQAAFQANVDNAVSKTINLPNSATVDDVTKAFMMAYKLGCKSTTIYRDGSRTMQVLENKAKKKDQCPKCDTALFMSDGIQKCVNCGYEKPKTEVKQQEVVKETRPVKLTGATYKTDTPVGTAYITVNHNGKGKGSPSEVFINVGKRGTEVGAISEAIGRLLSLLLRTHTPEIRKEILLAAADELSDIGGSRTIGFGPNRITGLPDAIGKTLLRHFGDVERTGNTQDFSLCPDCGQYTMLRSEGCKKCINESCGYAEC